MRYALAIIIAAVALAGAAFLGSADLKMHGHYHCAAPSNGISGCDPFRSYWVADRFVWQIPVAIVIAAVGLSAALAVIRRTSGGPDFE